METLLTDIIGFLRAVGPEVVFFVTLVETAFFIGLLVPAEATVLVAAFFVSEGIFEMEHVLVATLGGAFVGDQIGYFLGRYGGRRYAARGGRIGRTWAKAEPQARRMFGRHAIVGVSLARFVSFVRTLMPWFAGMTNMPYGRFALYDAIGVAGWGVASVLAGYAAGRSWHVLAGALGTASAVVVAMLVVVIVVAVVRNRVGGRTPAVGRVFRVGLTGNIASGKSAVAEEWARQGAPIIDADDLARVAVERGTPGLDRVRSEFGEGVIAADGTLDRAAMRSIVFADEAKRNALERILHPEIARLRDEREEVLRKAGRTIVAHVIPLLFEVGMQGEFDAIVLVDSPEEIRLDRLLRIRGLDADEAKAMIGAQMPAEQKKAIMKELPALTRVIDNDGTLDDLRERAREAWLTLERAVRTERADP